MRPAATAGAGAAGVTSQAAAVDLDVVPESGEHAGDVYIPLVGDEVRTTAPSSPRVGRNIVRVDTGSWALHPLASGRPRRPGNVLVYARARLSVLLELGVRDDRHRRRCGPPAAAPSWCFRLETR